MFTRRVRVQWAIGVDVVHIYVHSFTVDEVWLALREFKRVSLVVVHSWSEGDSLDDSVEHAFDFAQVRHTHVVVSGCHDF